MSSLTKLLFVIVAGHVSFPNGEVLDENRADDEATASDSCMENKVEGSLVGEQSGLSMLQSRNASNDNLVDFPAASRGVTMRKQSMRSGSISIKLLIDEGILTPGPGVLHMEYKGVSHSADLLEDGKIAVRIDGQEMTFDSPSAFSIYLKRLVNPTRKADDGWKSVRYKGNLLEHFKLELARKTFGMDRSSLLGDDTRRNKRQKIVINDPEPPPSPPRSPRVRTVVHTAIGADSADYLTELARYDSQSNQQPFDLYISPIAEALVDFHSHLCHDEVTGVLLGTIHDDGKALSVLTAMPIETKSNDDGTISKVEMDANELERRMKKLNGKGNVLQLVGTYHSHPDFAPRPTLIDTAFAVREQLSNGSSPYVHCIISPYDKSSPDQDVAPCTWYHMSLPPSLDTVPEDVSPLSVGCIPYKLEYKVLQGERVDTEDVTSLQKTVEHLAKMYAPCPNRVNIEGLWRKTEHGQVILRLRKIIQSFEAKLSRGVFEGKLRSFAKFKLEVLIRAVWSVYGRKASEVPSSIIQNETVGGDELIPNAKSVMMSNQNTESVAGVSSMQENGQDLASDDEPISDDDEKTE